MIVVTSICGGKDNLIHAQVKGDAKFIAFTDFDFKSDVWERHPAYDKFLSPRRNSRIHKILPHQFIEDRYSLWIDGNLSLLVPPEDFLKYLDGYDIAIFKHPTRDCLYDEGNVCAEGMLDDPETILNQLKQYEKAGYGKNRGLCEGAVIVRRHTPQVEAFNNYWWSEHCRHSVRDQVSMMYAMDKAGLKVNIINEHYERVGNRIIRGGKVEFINHITERPE